MANLQELVQYDAGVYQLEITDPVQGGPAGIANAPQKNLANRTAWLKKHVDDLESGATVPPGIAKVDGQVFTGSPTVPTAPSGDNSLKIANTEWVQRAVNGMLTKSVAGGANVTLTAVEAGYGILLFTGALTANISVIVPTVSGNWVVLNRTTGSFTLTIKTAAGTGIAVTQGKSLELTCDATNVIQATSDFNNTALTGSPTAPTPTSGDNDTSVATTAFVFNALDGLAAVSIAGGSNVTLTAAQAGSGILRLTGAITANIAVIVPTQSGQWIISNETTGNFTVTAKMATGTGAVLPQGLAVVVYSDGTNVFLASSSAQSSMTPRTFAPAAGTTTLTVPGGYTPGNLMVEKNGALLAPGDFTATNSSTVVLDTASITGDTFTIYVFSSFQLANAVQKSGDVMLGALALASGSTAATPATGDRSALLATMATFANEFAALKTDAGYQKLPSGLIIQWGSGITSSAGVGSVTFPIAFPNTVLQVIPTSQASAAGALAFGWQAQNSSSCKLYSSQATTSTFSYIAIGY